MNAFTRGIYRCQQSSMCRETMLFVCTQVKTHSKHIWLDAFRAKPRTIRLFECMAARLKHDTNLSPIVEYLLQCRHD